MNKPLKIMLVVLLGLVGLLLVLLLVASLLAGPIARSYVNGHGEELVGRKVQVEHIGLNLFTGHANVRGLTIYEDDGQQPFAGFDTLDVSMRLLALMGKEVYVNHFTLSGLDVRVAQNGTRFNFSSIAEHFKDDDPDTTDRQPSQWMVSLHQIRLRNGNVEYSDVPRGSHWDLRNMNLLVPDFCIGGGDASNGGLSLQLADGGKLAANATYNAMSNDFGVDIDLSQFALSQLLPYLSDVAEVEALDGRLDAHLKAKGNLDRLMQMGVSGDASIAGLDIVDNDGHSVASVGNVAVKIGSVNLEANRYNIESVSIDGLRTEFHVYEDGSNYAKLVKRKDAAEESEASPDTAAAPQQPSSAKPVQLAIGHFALANAEVTYADHTLPEDFVFPITQIGIESDGISLNGENSARMHASLPGGGHAMLRWDGNISDWKRHQHLRLIIKNLRLEEINPYMLAYTGQPFKDGTFSFVSENTITNSQLQGDNHIDIYKAAVEKRRRGVDAKMRLPLKAALYVLKDKDEKILLDVPVSGNIDQPEFSYMKLVWKTLGNLIVNVATSPIRGIGSLFSSDDDGSVAIELADPLSVDFTSEHFYEIDRLAGMAIEDESVSLVFEQQLPAEADSAAVSVAERRNDLLRRHLAQLKVDERRIAISTVNMAVEKPRYIVRTAIADLDAEIE